MNLRLTQRTQSTIAFAIILSMTTSAFGPVSVFASEKIKITPATIQARILSENYDVRKGMIDVVIARDNVLKSKLSLLPSLSGALTLSGSPLFLLNSVACLVPFLLPGKWYDLSASNQREMATVNGFYVALLNTYSMAYATIRQHVSDVESFSKLEARANRLDSIVKRVAARIEYGYQANQALDAAKEQAAKAHMDVEKAKAEMAKQRASIRYMSGIELPIDDDIANDFEIGLDGPIAPSRLEPLKLRDIQNRVFYRAPERTQILYLTAAAKAQRGSTIWSFLNGCAGGNMQQNYGSGSSTAAASVVGAANGLSVNISPTLIADIALANDTLDQLELDLVKAKAQFGMILEETKHRLEQANKVIGLTTEQLKRANVNYRDKLKLYELGIEGIDAVNDANNLLTQAEIDLIRAKSEFEGHRMTLKRMNLEDEFMDIYVTARKIYELGLYDKN